MDKQRDKELIDLAKEHLTDFINECGCETEEDVVHAIKVMLIVAASVKDIQLDQEDDDV
ncbi:hypothetical protein [Aeromonas tecta]|uniref:hypothetical protein n=1 Tax=Aeromonas tecta TaxID=324617 RepID=UPI000B03B945|nr:hypothetical protein [Aeromonas tecta]